MDAFLASLKASVTADGQISEDEVRQLKQTLAKHGMNEETLDVLLAINTELSGKPHPKSFEDLFVISICAYVLGSGSRLDEARWAWLKTNLLADDKIDPLERRLLQMIKQRARQYPPELDALLAD